MADIFISYASSDRDMAQMLARELESAGFSVWWDTNLIVGDNFRKSIHFELEKARAIVVIWTPRSVESTFVIDEADWANKGGKLYPLRTADLAVDKIPMGFRSLHTMAWNQRQGLVDVLRARLGDPRPKAPAAPPRATHAAPKPLPSPATALRTARPHVSPRSALAAEESKTTLPRRPVVLPRRRRARADLNPWLLGALEVLAVTAVALLVPWLVVSRSFVVPTSGVLLWSGLALVYVTFSFTIAAHVEGGSMREFVDDTDGERTGQLCGMLFSPSVLLGLIAAIGGGWSGFFGALGVGIYLAICGATVGLARWALLRWLAG